MKDRKTLEERKSIPVSCPGCSKIFKNIYSMSAHKGHCLGSNSTEHLNGSRGWSRGKILKSKDEIFCQSSAVSTGYAKKALLSLNLREHRCEDCGLDSWNGKEITLELDHINGMNNDHRLENLRLLCPNCHSQTPTWRGRNINSGNVKVSDEVLKKSLQKHSSIRRALMEVGLAPKGGNYARCKRLLT